MVKSPLTRSAHRISISQQMLTDQKYREGRKKRERKRKENPADHFDLLLAVLDSRFSDGACG